jgi:pimeloyl-ACP methyl ester carboxylesterase
MADIIPKSVLRIFPGVGHIPFLFEPEIFVQSIFNFIKEKNDR